MRPAGRPATAASAASVRQWGPVATGGTGHTGCTAAVPGSTASGSENTHPSHWPVTGRHCSTAAWPVQRL